MTRPNARAAKRSILALAVGLLLTLTGFPLAYGGALLVYHGGSFYYIVAGMMIVASGVLLIRQRTAGGWLYLLLYLATWVWALSEVGLSFWQLSPRVVAPTVLALLVSLSMIFLVRAVRRSIPDDMPARLNSEPRAALARTGISAIAVAFCTTLFLASFAIAAFEPHGAIFGRTAPSSVTPASADASGGWLAYGRTNEGRRFAPASQINSANVRELKVAWIARTGDVPGVGAADENTPLQVGDKVISCSPHSIVHAIDAESGSILWSFDPRANSIRPRCRSLGYFKDQARVSAAISAPATCAERILLATNDARLIALDLQTGKPCPGFGEAGVVDLKAGLGIVQPTHYFHTSAPTVTSGLVIVGGTVIDSTDVNVPSGVVRAFDARTGALRWFWDLGLTADPNLLPAGATEFTRGTPNVWAPPSVDERLGLVFLPTGNPSPDHWGGKRTGAMEKYGSSVVALDLATGKERWTFQTVHHDLWDYDVASQPTVYDIPVAGGRRRPALIVPTKRGDIFILDRRTGEPIAGVEERAVAGGAAAGDRLSPTQPFSVGMPAIGGGALRESDMWGFSPLDQLWCRIAFRKLRYEGAFTPPGTDPALLYPGTYGGFNWGSASIDEKRDLLVINDIRMPMILGLIPRDLADRKGKAVLAQYGAKDVQPGHGGLMMQKGTPFAAFYLRFVSPLGVPCQAPPYGTMTAIDLKSRQIAWQIPIGTVEDSGPLGIPMRMPIPIGMPSIGGSLVTGSGLIFFAGSQDHYLRAIDSGTGRELWKARLPVGSEATPMTYVSPRSGRQFVVVAASGGRDSTIKGDYVIAFSLPQGKGLSQ